MPDDTSSAGQDQEEERPEEDDWIASLEATALKAQLALQPYHSVLIISFGVVACFYGRHFTYSILFWRAFSTAGWPTARQAAGELRQRCRAAQVAARRELPEGLPSIWEASNTARQTVARLQAVHSSYRSVQQGADPSGIEALATEVEALQADLVPATRAGSALAAVSAELQPERLLEIVRGLYAAAEASLRAAALEGSAALGLGFDVGEAVARTVNRVAAPWLHRAADEAAARSSLEVRRLREDRNARRWIALGINALCNSLGLAAAFFVEARLFMLSNARVGAAIATREALGLLTQKGVLVGTLQPDDREVLAVQWLLCGAGIYFQLLHGAGGPLGVAWRCCWGAPPLPNGLRLVLGLPLAAEAWLRAAVAGLRGIA